MFGGQSTEVQSADGEGVAVSGEGVSDGVRFSGYMVKLAVELGDGR